jgi:hypothetical protein
MADLFEIQGIIDFIEEHPEEWNQKEWAKRTKGCGTACCVAGWAVVRAGYKLDWKHRNSNPYLGRTNCAYDNDGQSVAISTLAEKILGLTCHQATRLFDPKNDLEQIKQITKEIANGEI